MILFILSACICTLTVAAAPGASDARVNSNDLYIRSTKANYDNYWVPLRAAMKRNLKLLEKNAETLRKKFAEFTNQTSSFESRLIDSQIVEVLETIDKLQKQMDRTPVKVILPTDGPKPDVPSTTEKPITTPRRPVTSFAPVTAPWRPIFVPTAPATRPPSPIYRPTFPQLPEHPWGGMPAIAGFLTIDDGRNEMNAGNGRFLGIDWLNNRAFTDFLGSFLR